jgi:hypothetical protein
MPESRAAGSTLRRVLLLVLLSSWLISTVAAAESPTSFVEAPGGLSTNKQRAIPDTAWRLLYNALPLATAQERVSIQGDAALAAPLLSTRSVMV